MTVFLVDDERTFTDGRECVVALSADEAIRISEEWDEVDELWLDYVLRYSSSDEFLFHLKRRQYDGRPLTIKKAYIHTSSYMAVGLLQQLLEELGVTDIERVNWRDHLTE